VTDFDAAVAFAHTAAQVQDGVGLFCFSPESEAEPTTYRKVPVPVDLSIDRVLYRACQDLVALSHEQPVPLPATGLGPASRAEAAAESAEAQADDS